MGASSDRQSREIKANLWTSRPLTTSRTRFKRGTWTGSVFYTGSVHPYWSNNRCGQDNGRLVSIVIGEWFVPELMLGKTRKGGQVKTWTYHCYICVCFPGFPFLMFVYFFVIGITIVRRSTSGSNNCWFRVCYGVIANIMLFLYHPHFYCYCWTVINADVVCSLIVVIVVGIIVALLS